MLQTRILLTCASDPTVMMPVKHAPRAPWRNDRPFSVDRFINNTTIVFLVIIT